MESSVTLNDDASSIADTSAMRPGFIRETTWPRRHWGVITATVALPILSLLIFWLGGASLGSLSQDPFVEVKYMSEDLTSTTATFTPRVAMSGDFEYSHAFTLTNDEEADIVVERTSKSCSCLGGDIDKRVIKPGESASVPLRVRPGNLVDKSGSLTVSTRAGRTYLYLLKTRTYQPVMLDGDGISPLSAGLLTLGDKASISRDLFAYSESEGPLPTLKWEAENNNPSFSCNLMELGIESVGNTRIRRRRYRLNVNITAQSTPGMQIQRLAFKSVEPGQQYDFSTNVSWSVRSPIVVDPPRWLLKTAKPSATPITNQITLKHSGGLLFQVKQIECSHGAISVVRASPGLAASHTFVVSVAHEQIKLTKPRAESIKFHVTPDSHIGSPAASVEVLHVIITK